MSSRHAPPPPPLGGLPCSVLPSLLSLSLRFARVGDAGAAHLADAFVAGGGGSLTCLRLEGNTIGCAGCERLAASLAALPALRVLGFGDALGGNAIGDAGMCALASALAQTERDLIELAPDASGPPVVGAGHALRELGLHNNRIGSRGARALARALAAGGAPHLAKLGASGNCIGAEAVAELAGARAGLRPDCQAQDPSRGSES
uniref:Uncharacterized protein n=1 Tax=Emiliania huxleyi TaxID=2903 RepID=A0A7S3WMB9_EMIHU